MTWADGSAAVLICLGTLVVIQLFRFRAAIRPNPLVQAIKNGDTEQVRSLLNQGADPNTRETQIIYWIRFLPHVVNIPALRAKTGLMLAASGGRKDIADLLLEHDAQVDLKSCLACSVGKDANAEIVKLFIDRGANVNDYDCEPPLMTAASVGRLDIVKVLLDAGADVRARDDEGWTALMEPAGSGYREIVSILIAAGVEVNAKNKEGFTALTYAKEKNRVEIVAMLVRAGAKE